MIKKHEEYELRDSLLKNVLAAEFPGVRLEITRTEMSRSLRRNRSGGGDE